METSDGHARVEEQPHHIPLLDLTLLSLKVG